MVRSNFEGTVNVTTLTCNIISNNGQQVSTQWNFMRSGGPDFVAIAEGSEIFLIRNRLTILNLTSELDGVLVFCGTGAQKQVKTAQ